MNISRLHRRRRGSIWPLLLACLALILAAAALAIDSAMLWQARQELQVAADASALAAALELADDQLLPHRPGSMKQAVIRLHEVAVEIGHRHHVLGTPLELLIGDPPQSDVQIGYVDADVTGMQYTPPDDWDSPYINAVEITARRTRDRGTPVGLFFTRLFNLSSADVSASATAVFDRHIVGFRPLASINVPLIPIGLLSDPTGIDESSWEAQVDKPLSTGISGLDQYRFDKSSRQWFEVGVNTKSGDGLPEFTLKLPLSAEAQDINARLIRFNKANALIQQIDAGLSAIDLQETQGQLELAWDGLLPLNEVPMPTGNTLTEMVARLNKIHHNGEVRIWPLYLQGAEGSDDQAGDGVLLRGFVAARIAAVEQTENELVMTLQPTVLVTGTALTLAGAPSNNYVGKIKLIR